MKREDKNGEMRGTEGYMIMWNPVALAGAPELCDAAPTVELGKLRMYQTPRRKASAERTPDRTSEGRFRPRHTGREALTMAADMLGVPHPAGDSFTAHCPLHDDRNASLRVFIKREGSNAGEFGATCMAKCEDAAVWNYFRPIWAGSEARRADPPMYGEAGCGRAAAAGGSTEQEEETAAGDTGERQRGVGAYAGNPCGSRSPHADGRIRISARRPARRHGLDIGTGCGFP